MKGECSLCGQHHMLDNAITRACEEKTAVADKACEERARKTTMSDGSLENMVRLYRIERPKHTVTEFAEWFDKLKSHQESIKGCPWCHNQPALRVIPAFDKNSEPCLAYSVACEGDPCPVHPRLDLSFRTPEEAVKEWNDDH